MTDKKVNIKDTLSAPEAKTSYSPNGVGQVNIQHMIGADKRIENYERMVGNLFVGQMMSPQKVATNIGNRSFYPSSSHFRK